MNKFLKKLQYKNELKGIRLKVQFLLEEAQLGRATKVDIDYWDLYIERLTELSKNNISGAEEFLKFTIEMYEKYIEKLKE